MISYPIGNLGQTLILEDPVLAYFERHRQCTPHSREAGGQLFARFHDGRIVIERATGPRTTDRRGIVSFMPNRVAERREITRLFKSGFHYVGDWHTHPEPRPVPSQTDIESFKDMYRKSRHNLAGFVMIIVGTGAPAEGLFVGLCNDKEIRQLSPIP